MIRGKEIIFLAWLMKVAWWIIKVEDINKMSLVIGNKEKLNDIDLIK